MSRIAENSYDSEHIILSMNRNDYFYSGNQLSILLYPPSLHYN